MIYSPTEEGIAALKALTARMLEQVEVLTQVVGTLEGELDANAGGLGPHVASIRSVIEDMNEEVQGASPPISELAEKVTTLAASYQEFLDTDRFSNTGN